MPSRYVSVIEISPDPRTECNHRCPYYKRDCNGSDCMRTRDSCFRALSSQLGVLPFYCDPVTAQVIQIGGRSCCLHTIQFSADLIQMV